MRDIMLAIGMILSIPLSLPIFILMFSIRVANSFYYATFNSDFVDL